MSELVLIRRITPFGLLISKISRGVEGSTNERVEAADCACNRCKSSIAEFDEYVSDANLLRPWAAPSAAAHVPRHASRDCQILRGVLRSFVSSVSSFVFRSLLDPFPIVPVRPLLRRRGPVLFSRSSSAFLLGRCDKSF